jgi:hypothetical protein
MTGARCLGVCFEQPRTCTRLSGPHVNPVASGGDIGDRLNEGGL